MNTNTINAWDPLQKNGKLYSLAVDDDDDVDFEVMIKTLIEVCGHLPQQAEQCAWLIHVNGSCIVKTGLYSELKILQKNILKQGISARIL